MGTGGLIANEQYGRRGHSMNEIEGLTKRAKKWSECKYSKWIIYGSVGVALAAFSALAFSNI